MKYNTKYGAIWFVTMLFINAIIGGFGTMSGILLLFVSDSNFWKFLIVGVFCLSNVKVYFELAQNLSKEELAKLSEEV